MASSKKNQNHSFCFDQYSLSREPGLTFYQTAPSSSSKEKKQSELVRAVADPPGYVPGSFSSNKDKSHEQSINELEKQRQKIQEKAMTVAKSGFQQLMMTAFMLWMVGNTVQLFSLVMTAMSFLTPIKGFLNFMNVFEKYAKSLSFSELLMPRLVYLLLQTASLGLAFYKLNNLGLLPSISGISFAEVGGIRSYAEYSAGSTM